RATVELGAETPIRVGDEASLQFQGITGVSFVEIEGARADNAPLVAREGQPRPVIPSKPSAIEQLFTSAPDLLARAVVVLERFSALLNADNRRRVSNVLADLESVSGTLASRKENIGRIIDSIDSLGTELQSTVAAARSMAEHMDGLITEASDTLRDTDKLVEGDLRAMIKDIRATAKDLRTAANSADSLIAQNSEPLQLFTNEGLNQFSKFITEASILVTSMTRLTDRLESEGARFLLGTGQSEFDVEER
ncbi:MAG: MlaD family protein, partial [Gammaproteobacteria bacterium]